MAFVKPNNYRNGMVSKEIVYRGPFKLGPKIHVIGISFLQFCHLNS